MKKFIIVAACIILCACTNSQKIDNQEIAELEQEDTVLVVENQNVIWFYEKIITDIKGLEHLAIGASFSDIKKKYPNYIFEGEPYQGGDVYFFSDKEKTFRLSLGVVDDTLLWISFYNTNFKLYNGLMIGDPISKIKEKYPKIPISFDQHDCVEIFEIEDVNSSIRIDVESNDGELLGEYK